MHAKENSCEVPLAPRRKRAQPLLVEAEAGLGATVDSERVDVARAFRAPVDEIDPELERRLGRPHHIGFVDADGIVEILDVRQGRFADPDDPDLVGFDKADPAPARREQRNQPCGRHPTGGAAAKDHDFKGLVH